MKIRKNPEFQRRIAALKGRRSFSHITARKRRMETTGRSAPLFNPEMQEMLDSTIDLSSGERLFFRRSTIFFEQPGIQALMKSLPQKILYELKAFKKDPVNHQTQCFNFISKRHNPELTPFVRLFLRSPDPDIRKNAIKVLVKTISHESIPLIQA